MSLCIALSDEVLGLLRSAPIISPPVKTLLWPPRGLASRYGRACDHLLQQFFARIDAALRDADRTHLRRLTALPEEGVGRVQEFVPENSHYFEQKEKANAARQRELQEFDEKPFSGDFIGSAAFAGNAPQALMAAGQ